LIQELRSKAQIKIKEQFDAPVVPAPQKPAS
jgi:hypothetical protein